MKRTLPLGIVGALLAAMPVPGHHSITTYDLVHGTVLNGVATEFNWENPHARLYLDVTNEDTIDHWGIELESPNLLRRLGWDKQTIKPGDRIIATGGRARNGSFNLRAASIELPDGRKLRALQ